MAYVIQVNFDSYWKLSKQSEVFRFRGREYRLLRGRSRGKSRLSEKDCILSLLNKDDHKEYKQVYRDIMIYCACLSFEYHTPIVVGGGGGYGNSKEMTTRQLWRTDVTQRTMPTTLYYLSIGRIPYVYNRDKEDAVGLYREGLISTSPFYQFLCFWNILNIPFKDKQAVRDWINSTLKHKKHKIFPNDFIEKLKKGSENVGNYLERECRDAIAHIRRYPSYKSNIDPNDGDDYSRMWSVSHFLQDLVKIYMRDDLRIDKTQHLFPARSKKLTFPEYLTEEEWEKRRIT